MAPSDLIRALFYDDAVVVVEAALSTPATLESLAQKEKDMKAFGRFARLPFLHNPELPARLSAISAPTLVLVAEVDEIIPRAHSEAYRAAIANATLREVPRCAHGLYLERPDAVAREVIGFLAGSSITSLLTAPVAKRAGTVPLLESPDVPQVPEQTRFRERVRHLRQVPSALLPGWLRR